MKSVSSLARRPWMVGLGLFALGGLVMGCALAFAPASLRPAGGYNDYLSFFKPVATNLLAGRGYTGLNGHIELHDPPGYPLILAFLYGAADLLGVGREGMVSVFTALCLAAAGVLIYRVTRVMFGRTVGIVASVLWITYPVEVEMAPYRFSEVPYTAVLYLTTLVFVDGAVRGVPTWRRMTMVGALIGIDALIRPQAILLVIPFGLALWFRSHQVERQDDTVAASRVAAGRTRRAGGRQRAVVGLCAVMVVAYGVTISPWEIWVKVRTGDTVALSNSGPSAFINGMAIDLDPHDERGHVPLPAGVLALEKRVLAHQRSLTSMTKIASYMGHQLAAYPAPVLELLAIKAARSFYGTNSFSHETLIAVIQIPYLALMIAGLVLAWRSGGMRRWMAVFAIAVVVYVWLVTISVLSIVRYMGPGLGLFVPFAALALVELWRRLRRATTTGS
ncbi:MAG TPA: glycosyltransferase family 39 protein [Acidimicrobiales bacterium]|nr:glycosyltransferase family 39 protein [Acidimicrobiales bacterium]